MGFSIEHKASHREWDEAIIEPGTFFRLFEDAFSDDESEDGAKLETYDYSPTFHFKNGTMYGDEMWGVSKGRVWTSSYTSGVMNWSEEKRQYVGDVHFRRTELGDLVSVEIRLDDDLKAALSQAKK